jgi:hypothetical protein
MTVSETSPAHSEVEPETESVPDGEDRLASGLRLLCVAPVEPSWINLSLQLDAEGCHEPQFRWVSTAQETLTVLRSENFDCLVMSDSGFPTPETSTRQTSTPSATRLDPVALLRAVRASGCDDPAIFLAETVDDETWANLSRLDCEILITTTRWESSALVPILKLAVGRVQLNRENHSFSVSNHRRLVRERDETEHLLKQQREIVRELEALAAEGGDGNTSSTNPLSKESRPTFSSDDAIARLPAGINEYYHELLRTYVIMGSGGLAPEITNLAQLVGVAGLGPRDALELHLERVETLVRDLGNRSARHVMARADLLALELMIHLGEYYQRRAEETGDQQSHSFGGLADVARERRAATSE